MSKLWVITKSVYRRNVKSWGFVAMVLTPLIFLVIALGVGYLGNQAAVGQSVNLALVVDDVDLQKQFEASESENTYILVDSEEEGREQLISGQADAMLVVEMTGNGPTGKLYKRQGSDAINLSVEEAIMIRSQTAQVGERLGLTSQELFALMNQNSKIETIEIDISETGDLVVNPDNDIQRIVRTGVAYVILMFLFIFLVYYMQLIVEEIAKEKGSRVMEIVMSSMSATQHFFGKILGILLLIATHLAIYITLFLLVLLLNRQFGWVQVDLPPVIMLVAQAFVQDNRDIFLWSGAFAIIGALIYLALSAFFGSLASKVEDAQRVNTPMIFTILLGFYIGIFGLMSTSSLIVRIGSYIPFFTPFVMPIRIAHYSVSTTELWVMLGICLLFIVGCFWLATAFYQSNVLTYSDKGVWHTLKRSMNLKRNA